MGHSLRDSVLLGLLAAATVCLLMSTCGVVADAPVGIRVDRAVVMHGGSLRLTCVVPKHAANRVLDAGIPDLQMSARQLDGEQSPITWQFPLFEHIPCGIDSTAYCRLIRAGGQQFIASTHFEIAGCDDAD